MPAIPTARRSPIVALASLHALACLVVIANPLVANDEGLLMFGFARALRSAFAANFFWQKSKPALALFYFPTVPLGFGGYLVAHVIVAALAAFAIGEVARKLGHRRPWLSALVLAASPLFTWSALTGVSNSDGVAFIVFFLYLLIVVERPLAAGFVLGALPWIRFECAMFSALVALYLLIARPRRRFLVGLCVWPIGYLGAGAIYHHDALWFIHLLPSVSHLMAGNEVWSGEFSRHGLASLVETLALLTPTLGLLALLRINRLSSIERLLGSFLVIFLALFAITHFAPLENIGPAFVLGFSSRYATIAVPCAALVAGRVVDGLEDDSASRVRDSLAAAALVALGWIAKKRGADSSLLWTAAAAGAMVAATRVRATAFAIAAACALAIAGPLAAREALAENCRLYAPSAVAITDWLDAHRDQVSGAIFTNSKLWPSYVERSRRLRGARVRYMFAADQLFEIGQLTNEKNGQRAAVLRTIPAAVFGDAVMPDELAIDRVSPGTIFVLQDDPRTDLILPPATWRPRLQTLATIDDVTISRLK